MNCKCIEEINQKIKDQTGDPEAGLDVIYTFPTLDARIGVPYVYREKKKDGTYGKQKTSKLGLAKCPFCGADAVKKD